MVRNTFIINSRTHTIYRETFCEKKAFEDLALKELYNIVVVQKARPKIPETFPITLANLIRSCWQADPLKRPSLDQVIEVLELEDAETLMDVSA